METLHSAPKDGRDLECLHIYNRTTKEEMEDSKPAAALSIEKTKFGSGDGVPTEMSNQTSTVPGNCTKDTTQSSATIQTTEQQSRNRSELQVDTSSSANRSEAAETTKPEASLSYLNVFSSIHKELPHPSRPTAGGEKKMSVKRPTSPKAQRASSRKRHAPKVGQSTGRWTESEHQAFLIGLSNHGREWKKVAADIPTRTSAQVRSHAQKYFAKLQREEEENSEKAGADSVLLSPAVQANVDRIVAHPELVQTEVQETMQRLRRRYQQLQRRLQQTELRANNNDDRSAASNSTISSLQNEELIALSVLHGTLPRSGSEKELSTKRKRQD